MPDPNSSLSFDIREHGSPPLNLAVRLLPFIPAFVLVIAIYRYGVNVPNGHEWDLIPFVDQLLGRNWSWALFLMNEPNLAVKSVLAPLSMVTNFDVTALMYAGVGFQLLAFAFLQSVVESMLRPWYRRLIVPVSVAIALLMFSPVSGPLWLSGLKSLEAGLSSLAAAIIVWLLASRLPKPFTLGLSLMISFVGMRLPSGAVLWGIVFVAAGLRYLAQRKVQTKPLLASLTGFLLLAAAYFDSFVRIAGPPHLLYLATHSLQSWVFVLVYLGAPIAHVANSWIAGIVGLTGLILLIWTAWMVWQDELDKPWVQPWLCLSTYAVLAAFWAASTGVGRGIATALTIEDHAGTFFWVGLAAIAAIALAKRFSVQERRSRWIAPIIAVSVIACVMSYGRACYDGYVAFVRDHSERTAALVELYDRATAPPTVPTSLYADATRVSQYVLVMELRNLGPFTPRMLKSRKRLQNAIPFAASVASGIGSLDEVNCDMIAGWAWDGEQPNIPVRIDIYDGDALLLRVPAYRFRPDLLDGRFGNGRHSFSFMTGRGLKDNRPHMISAKISGTNFELHGSPKQLVCG